MKLQSKTYKAARPYFTSNLPIVIIDVVGGAAVTGSNQNATMKILPAGSRSIKARNYLHESSIRIKWRGSSSAEPQVTKKQYAITPRTPDFSSDAPQAFFDFEAVDKDWILQANYYDRSQLRFPMNLDLWNMAGSGWAPDTVLCEVILNGVYWGTHAFMDKITRNVARLNVAASTNALPNGGFIIKKDGLPDADEYRYTSSVNVKSDYIFVYPKVDPTNLAATTNIQTTVKAFTDAFETALASEGFDHPTTGWGAYADWQNFADMILLIELTKILDGYVRSMYYYRETSSGKLKYCPWDIGDWSYGDGERTGSSNPVGWWYLSQTVGQDSPSWAYRMMSGPNFLSFVKARWQTLRAGVWSDASINSLLNSYINNLTETGAIHRNFQRWNFLSVEIHDVHVNPIIGTWKAEIDNLKAWLTSRLSWMDSQLNN